MQRPWRLRARAAAAGAHHIGRDFVGAQHAEPELRDAGRRGAAAGRLAGAGRDRLRRRLLLALHDLGARLVQRRCARACVYQPPRRTPTSCVFQPLHLSAPPPRQMAPCSPCTALARSSHSGAAAAAPCAGRAGFMPQGTPSTDNMTSSASKVAVAPPPPSRLPCSSTARRRSRRHWQGACQLTSRGLLLIYYAISGRARRKAAPQHRGPAVSLDKTARAR